MGVGKSLRRDDTYTCLNPRHDSSHGEVALVNSNSSFTRIWIAGND